MPADSPDPAPCADSLSRATDNGEDHLGSAPIASLLLKMSLPAAMGFLALTVYQVIDTIFIGRFIGVDGIGGIAVVMPIILLISSVGRGLGVGGGSVIARSLGADDIDRANQTLTLLVLLCLLFSTLALTAGFLFPEQILHFFGGRGTIYAFSRDYFLFLLPGLPFLSFAMLSNNVIRAEGNARQAMLVMVIPAVINILLDPLFIVWLDWGMRGAAMATTLAYLSSALFAFDYFARNQGPLRLRFRGFRPDWALAAEVLSIGATPIARQGSAAVLAVVMNKTLFHFGGELAVATYGIVHRLLMFVMFPVIGLSQGFIPICGYNLGAGQLERVRSLIRLSLKCGVLIGMLISTLILLFATHLTSIFTPDAQLIAQSSFAIRLVFLLMPLTAVQLLCSVYFQSLGQALPSLMLTLLRQGLILIPLVLILPRLFGLQGIWLAFPGSDFLACLLSVLYTIPCWRKLAHRRTVTRGST